MEVKKEILYDGILYDVTNWIKKHPGGNIMELYTKPGEDSTLAVQQFHQRTPKKVMSIMKSLPHRKQTDDEMKKWEVGKKERYDRLTKDFSELRDTLIKEGLFEPSLVHVFFRISEFLLLCVLGLYILKLQSSVVTRIVGILVLSLGVGRAAWVLHEALHLSLTGRPKLDRYIRSFIMGLFMGCSGAQWAIHHTKHHASPQHVKYDSDIKSLPIAAFNKDTVVNPKAGKGFLVQQQSWLFFPLGPFLIALWWMFYVHPIFCYRKRIYSDLLYIAIHYAFAWNYIGFVNHWLVIWLAHVYLTGNIVLSHSHLPATNEPTHWVEYGLIHTSNVRSSTFGWVDYWMGHLNHQIEHHLFPTMPQHKNKLCRDRVKALAKKHNLPYRLYWYGEIVVKCLENLGAVAKELANQN